MITLRFLLGLALCISALPVPAADRGSITVNFAKQRPSDVARNIPQGQPGGRWDVAVVVANGNYRKSGVPKVDFAHRDGDMVKRYLVRTLGFAERNIIYVKDASTADMRTLFGTRDHPKGKLARFVRKGKSRVFVYYVGHGAPDPEKGESYFVPVDADPDFIGSTGYSLSTFYQNLRRLPAKDVFVAIDACFSGQTQNGLLFKDVSPAMLRIKETAAGMKTGAVLSSSKGNQLSTWYRKERHSMFTYYFLKGLQGAADKNKDGKLTTGELAAYVGDEVEYMAGREVGKTQTPRLQGKRDLVLVRYR